MSIALSLAEQKYYGGDIDKIMKTRVDYIMLQYNYMQFINDYQSEVFELNKETK